LTGCLTKPRVSNVVYGELTDDVPPRPRGWGNADFNPDAGGTR
jgi:hypothetical protein